MATSLPQEDINFLRLAGLLIRIAPRAVRRLFDKEFHPDQLKQFLRKNRPKIDDLTFKKKVITQAEYELLYPKGSSGVSSDKFDISLMVCLLRNSTDLDIQDSLPLQTNLSTAADISRIKFYRNYIVHSESGEVTENKFTVIWKCLEEAILRLLPELKPEIEALMSSSLTNIGDMKHVIRLEKELEKTNQKLETLEIQKNNFREIRNRILKEWRETDKKYVSTSAKTFIFKSLQHNKGVIITGSPGCGKSAAAHHVALELEKEGYEIFPCDDPSEILNHFKSGKFQVFVLDDVCGKFTLNPHKADSWDEYDGKLNMILELNQKDDKNDSSYKSREDKLSKSMEDRYIKLDVNVSRKSQVKFIITCRENIYSHKAFPKLACFSLVQCSFSTYYKMSLDEMQKIALAYVSEDTVNGIQNMCLFDFFPLICALYCKKVNRDPRFFTHPVEIIEKEISVMKIKSESSFLCLSLLVLKNNNISKDDLRSGDVGHLVESVCSDCDIELVVSMVTLQNCFERLKGIYIIEEGEIYKAIHDKMFDIIASAIASSIMKSLIMYADIAFLANRIQLLSLGRSNLSFAVYIPQEFERVYLKRIFKEAMSGKYWEVFGGIHVENEAYRKLLLSYLKEQDTFQQSSYETSKDGSTPLFVSSSLGYVDFVKYFVAKCPNHISIKDKEGRSSFYVACKNGHTAVVKYLIHYYEDVNAEMAYKTTALSSACYNGHIEVAKLLLENNADINRTNNLKHNALYCACYSGNVQLVSLLLRAYNLDRTIRDSVDQHSLHTSCQKGHTNTLKHTKEFCRDVNQQSDIGWTPLHIACRKGHYEIVKLVLDLNRQTLENCVDTTIKDNTGCSILHIACDNGPTEVVKLLIGVGMNVNDTTDNGQTSLFAYGTPTLSYNAHFSLYVVHLPLYDVHSPLYDVHLSSYGVQTSLYDIQISLYDVQTSLYDVQTSLYDAQTSLYDVQTSLYDVQTSLYDVQTSLYDVHIYLYDVQIYLYDVQTFLYDVKIYLSYVDRSLYDVQIYLYAVQIYLYAVQIYLYDVYISLYDAQFPLYNVQTSLYDVFASLYYVLVILYYVVLFSSLYDVETSLYDVLSSSLWSMIMITIRMITVYVITDSDLLLRSNRYY